MNIPDFSHYWWGSGDVQYGKEEQSLPPLQQEELYGKESYLEYLADSLHLPVQELIEADQNGRLAEVLQEAQEIEAKCFQVFKKLDQLYASEGGAFVTKSAEGSLLWQMSEEDLELIKSVIRSAFKVLAKPAPKHNLEAVLSISKDYKLLIKSTESSLTIQTLFGKMLGHGAYGFVVLRMNLLEAEWDKTHESVIKLPWNVLDSDVQLEQEAAILSSIHDEGDILGIQSVPRLVRDLFTGNSKYCLLEAHYQSDLSKALGEGQIKSLSDLKCVGYQLFYGLASIHAKDMTHGDIKRQNIFYSPIVQEDGSSLPGVFIADFGGAIDFSSESIHLQETFTEYYRPKRDTLLSEEAFENNDMTLYHTIEEAADVFGTCATYCECILGTLPYAEGATFSNQFNVSEGVLEKLMEKGLSREFSEMLIRGLNSDYSQRPSAKDIFYTCRKDAAGEKFMTAFEQYPVKF